LEKKGRLLGLDFGTKRIGIAITDENQVIAQPLCIINREGNKKDIEKIKDILRKYEIQKVIVGVAENDKGEISAIGKKSMEFGKKIEKLGVEVVFLEESFTTSIAHEVLSKSGVRYKKRREYVDKIAATIILQDYLRSIGK
jgi:putative Holliday junction resolvase